MPAHKQPPQRAKSKSFREFALLLKSAHPSLKSFAADLASEPLPNVNSWTEVRTYLDRSGADHARLSEAAWPDGNTSRRRRSAS